MKRLACWCAVVLSLLCVVGIIPTHGQDSQRVTKTKNVFLIVSDGLRWQEIFTGAEKDLLTTDHGGNWASKEKLSREYWRESAEERRKVVFPFLWTVIAKQGQIFGNQLKGSVAHVTNGKAFSYPGYNEMSTGYPNDAITTNEFGPRTKENPEREAGLE